jgi:hypothetical protein
MDHWTTIIHKCCCSAFYGVRHKKFNLFDSFFFKCCTEKVTLAKEIIVNLAQFMAERKEDANDRKYLNLSVERFLQNNQPVLGVSRSFLWLKLIMMVYSVSTNGNMECYLTERQSIHTSMLTQYFLKLIT